MSRKVLISRRKMLLTTAMAVALPSALAFRNHNSIEHSLHSSSNPIDQVLKIFTSTASAVVLGRLYLKQYPEEDSLDTLALHLQLPSRNKEFAGVDAELGALHAHIRSQVRRDFESGNCVRIDGWVLSRTEARACAIATFAKSRV